ncbi:hypothetical protein EBB07_12740 [Paenibacillaceae bacterium]|nr:hypothetical protein EBB07_12740 [Paenibacillaceae bacterium]
MSRSWERMVRKNTTKVNKGRKKSGTPDFIPKEQRLDKYRGRNYILPIAILAFTAFYAYIGSLASSAESPSETLYWVTVSCYVLLGLLFYFRRPYLTVAKEFVQTRKMTGEKTLRASGIKRINVQPGYIVIEQVKGASWIFSKMLNRFPTEMMGERLKEFANDNNIEFSEKTSKGA